jgi:hypothetical protein
MAIYRVAPGQSLQFDLPTRRAKPGGKLGGLSGSLHIDLHKLEASTGKLEVDFREIKITEPPLKPTTKKAQQDAPFARAVAEWESLDFRAEALRWLSLGSKVSVEERERATTATFTIESLRDLSHPSPSAGAFLKSKSGGGFDVRQVRVHAIGELSWRGLSVHREVPLLLRFQFKSPPSDGDAPVGLEVGIHGSFLVPLAEYGIEPRDEAGHSESEERALIGQEVGSNARIRGEVRLDRATQ